MQAVSAGGFRCFRGLKLVSCAAMIRILYSLLLSLLLPLLLLRLLWRSRRLPSCRQRLGERLGLVLPALQPGGIWIHAVSVGESIAAAPLVEALLARYPQYPVTVTSMTLTGSQRIRALFGDRVQHCYLPYDLPWAAGRFLARLQPRLAIIMETELWPNYLQQCARRRIPLVLANARLSARSASGYARIGALVRPMLQALDWIAAQSTADAARFCQLGARPEGVSVTGSIKFDQPADPALPARARQWREQAQSLQRPTWIAASTHAGEEEQVLAAHRQLLAVCPDALLILVPRHPERFAAVAGLCHQAGLCTLLRSSGRPLTTGHQVLLGDSMGELPFLYALADWAFVGGSLVARGGHNLLEPAALGLPLLSGPHLFNFQAIAGQLQDAGALALVADGPALTAAVQQLALQPARRQAGRAGQAVVDASRGALQRLLDGLEPWLCASC